MNANNVNKSTMPSPIPICHSSPLSPMITVHTLIWSQLITPASHPLNIRSRAGGIRKDNLHLLVLPVDSEAAWWELPGALPIGHKYQPLELWWLLSMSASIGYKSLKYRVQRVKVTLTSPSNFLSRCVQLIAYYSCPWLINCCSNKWKKTAHSFYGICKIEKSLADRRKQFQLSETLLPLRSDSLSIVMLVKYLNNVLILILDDKIRYLVENSDRNYIYI